MGNFSDDPDETLREALQKGYTGVRIEQGVPLLDRDLNLMSALNAFATREFVRTFPDHVVGDTDFMVNWNGQDLTVQPGTCFVDGMPVWNGKEFNYHDQSNVEEVDWYPAGRTVRLVYLDVSAEKEFTEDLDNPGDVGTRTSVRRGRSWRVRIADDEEVPELSPQHRYIPLATVEMESGGVRVEEDQRPLKFSVPSSSRLVLSKERNPDAIVPLPARITRALVVGTMQRASQTPNVMVLGLVGRRARPDNAIQPDVPEQWGLGTDMYFDRMPGSPFHFWTSSREEEHTHYMPTLDYSMSDVRILRAVFYHYGVGFSDWKTSVALLTATKWDEDGDLYLSFSFNSDLEDSTTGGADTGGAKAEIRCIPLVM